MVYGHAFYFDQPVKRIWYTCGELPANQHWAMIVKEVFNDPVNVPNELYDLFRGKHRFEPSVMVNTEMDLGYLADGEAWVDAKVRNDIRTLTEQGFSHARIRELLINVDDAVRAIRCLRSALTVNAGLYYDLNETAITDHQWDEMALALVALQKRYAHVLPFVDFFDSAFDGFDGSTGFHLPYRVEPFLTNIKRAAEYLEKHRKL